MVSVALAARAVPPVAAVLLVAVMEVVATSAAASVATVAMEVSTEGDEAVKTAVNMVGVMVATAVVLAGERVMAAPTAVLTLRLSAADPIQIT